VVPTAQPPKTNGFRFGWQPEWGNTVNIGATSPISPPNRLLSLSFPESENPRNRLQNVRNVGYKE
jgi:hypothetical protein